MSIKTIVGAAYLVTLVGFLAFKATETVYHGSTIIGLKPKVQHLTQTKAELLHEKSKLAKELSQATSLALLSDSNQEEGFVPIDTAVTITTVQAVASR